MDMIRDDDELERLLRSTRPEGAPSELRSVVLTSVYAELASVDRPRGSPWLAWSVAAALLVAAGLNGLVGMNEQQRMARLFPPLPPRQDVRDVASAVASATDDQTGQWFGDYLTQRLSRRGPRIESRRADELSVFNSAVQRDQLPYLE
jgi:hypothetical protein